MFSAYQGDMFSFIANQYKFCIAFGLVANLAIDCKYLLVELENEIGKNSGGVEDGMDKTSEMPKIGMQISLLILGPFIEIYSTFKK